MEYMMRSTSIVLSCTSSMIMNLYLFVKSSNDRFLINCRSIPVVVNNIPFFIGFFTNSCVWYPIFFPSSNGSSESLYADILRIVFGMSNVVNTLGCVIKILFLTLLLMFQ